MNQDETDKLFNLLKGRDIQSLEAYDKKNMSKLQHFLKTIGTEVPVAGELDNKVMQVITSGTKVNAAKAETPVIIINDNKYNALADGVARFNLKIDRKTANIAAILPVPLFGSVDYSSDWIDALAARLPAGCTYEVARTTDKKGIKITYTVGAAVDIVEITCKNKPYISLLESSKNALIVITQMKLKLNDVANEEQFAEEIVPFHNSMFGRKHSDGFTADDFERDDQEKDNMRTINQRLDITGFDTIVMDMAPIADNVVNASINVEFYNVAR